MNDYSVSISGDTIKIKYIELMCLDCKEAKRRAMKKVSNWGDGIGCENWNKIHVNKLRKVVRHYQKRNF